VGVPILFHFFHFFFVWDAGAPMFLALTLSSIPSYAWINKERRGKIGEKHLSYCTVVSVAMGQPTKDTLCCVYAFAYQRHFLLLASTLPRQYVVTSSP
jgi:hypothetical protein